jgi:type II secretory pathway component PulF
MTWASASAFYHHLGMMLKTGIPLPQAIEHAGDAAGDWHRLQARDLARGCASGESLAAMLSRHGEHPLSIALIDAGERSGRMPEMCSEIEIYFDHCRTLRRLFMARTVYPALLIHAVLVIPQLPAVILGRAGVGSLLIGPGLLWAAIAAAFIANTVANRTGLFARLAFAPFLRELTRPFVAANTCLVLRAGMAAGLLHHQSLELAAPTCGNRIYAQRIRQQADALSRGATPNLTAALAALGFPALVVQVAQAGEIGGTLEDAMARAARIMREAFHDRTLWTVRIICGMIYGVAVIIAAATIISMYAGYVTAIGQAELSDP